MTIYVVAPGDTVSSIAAAYQIPSDTIIYNNQLIFPYTLVVGQALLLSTPSEQQPSRFVVTNGYAYPFISNWVLTQTLPYLSRLSVFSYGFSSEGDIIPPVLDDSFMIQAAYEYQAAPFLTLTPIDASGRFNNNLISSVLNNPTAKDALIDNLVMTVT